MGLRGLVVKFVKRTFAQLTLHRWVEIATSKVFYAVFFGVVLATAILGPYGLFNTASFADRLALALKINVICWFIGIAIAVPFRLLLQRFGLPLFLSIFLAAVVASVGIVFALSALLRVWIGLSFNATQFAEQAIAFLVVVHLLMVFLMREHGLLTPSDASIEHEDKGLLTARQQGQMKTLERSEVCPLQKRLPVSKRGLLCALVAQDHYVEIVTEKGSDLVLMRFSDAVKEVESERGLRVHRSVWVSAHGLKSIEKEHRRHFAILFDGRRLPVARGMEKKLSEFVEQPPESSLAGLLAN